MTDCGIPEFVATISAVLQRASNDAWDEAFNVVQAARSIASGPATECTFDSLGLLSAMMAILAHGGTISILGPNGEIHLVVRSSDASR